jgi:hypothetical protein
VLREENVLHERCGCGAVNESNRIRCARCGATIVRVQERTTRRHSPVPPAPPSSAPAESRAQRRHPHAEQTLAYLCSGILEHPFPISRGTPISIGRSPSNSIVLPVPQVSREHARIEWEACAFVIADRGSTNGTFVNGIQVHRRELNHGDRVGIGPFELVFAMEVWLQGRDPEFDGSKTCVFTVPGCFAGKIDDLSVPEVFQMIDVNQKTGVLSIAQDDLRGEVCFQRGRAIHAEVGERTGDKAALALLGLREGSFRFMTKESVAAPTTIGRSTASLLLEAVRLLDEATLDDPDTRDTIDSRPGKIGGHA